MSELVDVFDVIRDSLSRIERDGNWKYEFLQKFFGDALRHLPSVLRRQGRAVGVRPSCKVP